MADQTPSTEQVRDCYATGAPNPLPRLKQQSAHLYAEFDAWLDDHDQAHAVATLQDAINHLKWFAGRLGPGELARGVVAAWQELRLMAERIEGNREAARG